jgi:hypothetical protein
MYARQEVHPGLIVMPATVGRDRQQQLVRVVIDWIIRAAAAPDERPDDFMLGTLVEIDENSNCSGWRSISRPVTAAVGRCDHFGSAARRRL